jgi:hypothetical protein
LTNIVASGSSSALGGVFWAGFFFMASQFLAISCCVRSEHRSQTAVTVVAERGCRKIERVLVIEDQDRDQRQGFFFA